MSAGSTDLAILTRDMFVKSFRDEVSLNVPLLAMFEAHSRVTFEGGVTINRPVIKATGESLMQMYSGNNTPLTASNKSYLAQPSFKWKKGQIPALIEGDDYIQNVDAASENKIADLAELVVKQVQQGIRLDLNTQFHATTAAGDSGTDFQSVPEALGHSRTYGGITSNTTTVKYWNGASLLNSYADAATTTGISLDVMRRCKMACMRYGLTPQGRRFYCFLPEASFSKVVGLAEAAGVKPKDGRLAKFGIESVEYSGIEFVVDSYMTDNSMTAHMLLLDPMTWEFRLHPKRAFTMSDFVDQSQMAGGTDQMLARCLVAGALVCWQPNGNMYKSAIS